MVKKTKADKKLKTKRPLRTEKETLTIGKKKLADITEEWRTTFDAIKDAISLIDVEGKIIRCNRAMVALLGKPFPDILGQKCWKLVHGTSGPIEGCPVVRMKETLKEQAMILPIDERVFEVTANPIFDDSGGLSGAVHIISDITDRKQAEEALRESKDKYKTLTENSLTGIFIHQDGRFVFVNDTFAEIHGYKLEELLGKEHLILIHPDERDTLRELALKRLKGESVPQRYEVRRIRKDGTTIYCEMMAALTQYGGRPAIMGNIIDITERKKTEEDLKKSYEEILLRQASMLNISEDLLKEVEERKIAEERIKEYSSHLRKFSSQMALVEEQERRRIANLLHDSIGQNLALTKIKLEELKELSSSEALSTHFNELQKIIDEAINSARSLTFDISPPILYELGFEAAIEWLGEQTLKTHNILFEFRDDRKSKPLTNMSRVVLYQAIREFLINIIKHSKAHKVKIFLQKNEGDICINIEDDGIGFDIQDISSKMLDSGSFGLFSVRERLIFIGGHFEINSVPGQGTQIILTAPLEI
jgi:PAS domain S-box-containing protein